MALVHFYQYSCELQIKHPHLAFRTANEPWMERWLTRYNKTKQVSEDGLPKWFYFYILPIRDPLTVTHHADGDVELHPGTNRFIGRSLVGDEPWAPCRIVSIGRPWDRRISGIRHEQLISTADFEYTQPSDFYSNTDLQNWCFGSYAPTAKTWMEIPEQFARTVLGEWGGELVSYDGKTVNRVNTQASNIIRVHVKDHEGLFPAVQDLFGQLKHHVNWSLVESVDGV